MNMKYRIEPLFFLLCYKYLFKDNEMYFIYCFEKGNKKSNLAEYQRQIGKKKKEKENKKE